MSNCYYCITGRCHHRCPKGTRVEAVTSEAGNAACADCACVNSHVRVAMRAKRKSRHLQHSPHPVWGWLGHAR